MPKKWVCSHYKNRYSKIISFFNFAIINNFSGSWFIIFFGVLAEVNKVVFSNKKLASRIHLFYIQTFIKKMIVISSTKSASSSIKIICDSAIWNNNNAVRQCAINSVYQAIFFFLANTKLNRKIVARSTHTFIGSATFSIL